MICAQDEKFPEIREEIQQLADNIGADYDTARIIYETNNGHGLDKAPNGAESKLYSDLLSHYNGDVKQAQIAKARLYLTPFREWFGDWTDTEATDVSKVIDENDEPLVVYHGDDFEFNGLNRDGAVSKQIYASNKPWGRHKKDYPIFLNIKNPRIEEWGFTDDFSQEFENVEKEVINKGYDGAIGYYEEDGSKKAYSDNIREFYVINPNQIKSIDNRGTYSTTDDNVYNSLKTQKNPLKVLVNRGLIHKYRGLWYVTQKNRKSAQAEATVLGEIKLFAESQGLDATFYPQGPTKPGEPMTVVFLKGEQKTDKLEESHELVNARPILRFLQERFPGLKYEIVSQDKAKQNQNAWIEGDTIYLVEGRFTDEIAVHEALHPFVHTLYLDNSKLFNELFEEAKQLYGKLWGEIQATYVEDGMTESTRRQELVTQALAREFKKEHSENEPVPYREFAKKYLDWFRRLLLSIMHWVGDHGVVYTNKIERMKLGELAKMINTSDTQFTITYAKERMNSLSSRIADLFDHGHTLTKMDQEFEVIKKGLATRLKALQHYKNKNLYQIRTTDRLIKDMANLDAKQGILAFFKDAQAKMQDAHSFLQKPIEEINIKQLVQLQRDLLGFYIPTLNSIASYLEEFQDVDNFENDYWEMTNKVRQIEVLYSKLVRQKATQYMVDVAEQAGFPDEEIQDIINYMKNPVNDVNAILSFVGSASGSSNKIIRMARRIIGDSNNNTARTTLSKGRDLLKLYSAAKKSYSSITIPLESLFQERDKNGKKTGYFVRDLNYGQFYQDLSDFVDKLRIKHKVALDEDNIPVFDSREQEIAYRNELDTWKCEHGERRYNLQYYLAKNKHLSQMSREALDDVDQEIHQILNSVTTDRVHIEKLTDRDLIRYNQLIKRKESLYSTVHPDGLPKNGEDLQIALELQAFRNELKGKLKYKPDDTRFEEERARMLAEFGEDSDEYKRWLYLNTEIAYTEDYYEELSNIASFNPINQLQSANLEHYHQLIKTRADILKYYRAPRSLVPDVTAMSRETIELVKQLDRDISELYQVLKQEAADQGLTFEENAPRIDEISQTFKTQYYKDLERDAYNSQAINPDSIRQFEEETSFEDASGKIRVYSLYEYRFPRYKKHILFEKPNKFWQQLDLESEWANPNFNPQAGYIQPKRNLYDNTKAYNKIQANQQIKALYDALIATMQESNAKVGFLESVDNFKLPQISGRFMTQLRGNDALFTKLGHYAKDEMAIRNDDTEFNEAEGIRPDGSKIYNIPTRFIHMLENPDTITDDVIGSVISYFNMAEDFQNKSQILDEMEMFRYFLEPEIDASSKRTLLQRVSSKIASSAKHKYAVKQYAKFLEMNLYGMQKTRYEFKLLKHKFNIGKAMSKFYNYISLRNLGWNLHPAVSGTIAALGLHNLNSVLGKYYTVRDSNFALTTLTINLPELFINIGNVNNTNKLMQIMQMNQICRNVEETFSDLDLNQLQRAIYQHGMMGHFTAGDMLLKSQIVLSVYNNYRLVEKDGVRKFMSLTQFTNQFYPDNRKSAETEFYKFKVNLYDAYVKDKDGILQVDPRYSDVVTTTLMNEVTNKCQMLSSRADGTLNELDKAQIHQDVFTSYTAMHRNYLLIGYESMFCGRRFNYQTMEYEQGTVNALYTSIIKFVKNIFTLGKKGIFTTKLNSEEIYALKYLGGLAILIFIHQQISAMLKDAAEDDDDNYFLQFSAYDVARSTLELSSIYNPMETNNLLKSVTPASGFIDPLAHLVLKPGDWDKKVVRGAYKDMPWGKGRSWQRDLIKLTPLKNVVESSTPEAIKTKRKYLESQLAF